MLSFGVSEKLVKQRLAIADLIAPILNAFRHDRIDGATMRVLTLATKRQQKEWFKLFTSDDERAPLGYQLKCWLFGGDEIPTTSALFDVDIYKGAIVTDLFGDEGYFADSGEFWQEQSRAINAMIEDYEDDGWSEVILLDVGEHWPSWEHVDTAKEDGGKVFIHVARNGEVTPYEGQLSRDDIKKRERLEKGEEAPTLERCELTKSMQNYLELHRHSAVRAELLNHQGIALRLSVAQIIAGSSLFEAKADPQKANSDAIRDSLCGNRAQDSFSGQREQIRALLGFSDKENCTIVPGKGDWAASRDLTSVFAKLLKLDDETVTRILSFVIAETLPCGSAMVEILGILLSVNMADHWTQDDTSTPSVFFDLLRDKQAINEMLKEIAPRNQSVYYAAQRTSTWICRKKPA